MNICQKKGFFIISAIILGLSLLVGTQFPEVQRVKQEIEFEIVYEKTFDEEILDVIFDTATVSIDEAVRMGWKEEAFTEEEKAKGKVLVSYPKVVLISRGRELSWLPDGRRDSYSTKELRFFGKDNKMMKSLALKDFSEERVYLSPQRKYILISKVPQEWNPEYSGGALYDLNGRKIWEITKAPTTLSVSDESYVVAGKIDWICVPPEPGGSFYVYNNKGRSMATVENPDQDRLAPILANFSKDGEYALLCFSAGDTQPAVFVLITQKGEVLWKKEVACIYSRAVGETDILPNKGVIGCIYKGGLKLFYIDWAGNLRWLAPLTASGYACCRFAQDGKRVYASSSRGYLWSFDLKTGRTIWMHKEPWSPPLEGRRRVPGSPEFRELYELGQHIVVNGTYKVLVFDSETGKLVAETEYGKDTRIFLSPHNGRIFVIDVKGKRVLGLEGKEG